MGILNRFKTIMTSNINALLEKAENPEKTVDQYLSALNKDLGKVKSETASIIADEQRKKRAWNTCLEDMDRMEKYARKALEAENEADARKFLERKVSLAAKASELQLASELASKSTVQMRQMHDKLVSDVSDLEARRMMIKEKMSLAKTRDSMNKIGSSATGVNRSVSPFGKMEEKADRALEEANARAELQGSPQDDIMDLTAKYDSSSNVDEELAALREKINHKE